MSKDTCVLKRIDADAYIKIDEFNEISVTYDIDEAKLFKKDKARNILKNHSIPNWKFYDIKEYTPTKITTPKNQIDFIKNRADTPLDSTKRTTLIEDPESLALQIFDAKEAISNDIKYYDEYLIKIQRAITDVNHFLETIDVDAHPVNPFIETDLEKLAKLSVELFKKRRWCKNKIDLLLTLEKQLYGEHPKEKDDINTPNKTYIPRLLNKMFETKEIPTFNELVDEGYFS